MMVGMADQTVGTSPPCSRMCENTSNSVMAACVCGVGVGVGVGNAACWAVQAGERRR